jgi:hypothetical protein
MQKCTRKCEKKRKTILSKKLVLLSREGKWTKLTRVKKHIYFQRRSKNVRNLTIEQLGPVRVETNNG